MLLYLVISCISCALAHPLHRSEPSRRSSPSWAGYNQCHPKEFDVLALMEQVMNWEKPAILVPHGSHFKLLDSRH